MDHRKRALASFRRRCRFARRPMPCPRLPPSIPVDTPPTPTVTPTPVVPATPLPPVRINEFMANPANGR
ncbi:MAG: hypothetical protein R3A10_04355 [Caldilineaceae bacterium]